MQTKNLKVAYTSRQTKSSYTSVPKIQMEGKWLEELGFAIGTLLKVEFEEGSIRIRPLTEEEAAERRQQELKAELDRKSAELKQVQLGLAAAYAGLSPELSQVAESKSPYSPSGRKSKSLKKSNNRRHITLAPSNFAGDTSPLLFMLPPSVYK